MFRGLLFEAEAEKFRSAGIRVGANEAESERELFEEMLEPFGIDLRNEALRMARLFALIYCFENSVRRLLVIIANWEDFSDLVPSQHWIKQRFDELENARNFIAHNRLLLPGEFQRLEMYVSDWNRNGWTVTTSKVQHCSLSLPGSYVR